MKVIQVIQVKQGTKPEVKPQVDDMVELIVSHWFGISNDVQQMDVRDLMEHFTYDNPPIPEFMWDDVKKGLIKWNADGEEFTY